MANIRVAFVVFIISCVIAFISIGNQYIIAHTLGNPTSIEGIEIRRVNAGLSLCTILVSLIGLVVLVFEFGHKILAIFYILALLVSMCLAAVVIIRTIIWQGYSEERHIWDQRNASVRHVASYGSLSPHLLSVQSEHKCCGVANALEWPQPTVLNIQRRIPDACCVHRSRRCGEKALPREVRGDGCDEECFEQIFVKKVSNEKLIVELANFLPADDTFSFEERQGIKGILVAKGTDFCDPNYHNEMVYLHINAKDDMGTLKQAAVSWSVEIICFEFYHRKIHSISETPTKNPPPPDTGDKFDSYEDFLIYYLEKSGKYYAKGCKEFLKVYTAKIIANASYYAGILFVLAFMEIIIFYHYYWKYRLVQLAEIPVPTWFEKLGAGDTAPIGIGRKTITLPEDPEEIARNFHRRGLLSFSEKTGEDFLRMKANRGREAVSKGGRHPSVRVYPLQNLEYYPSLDLRVHRERPRRPSQVHPAPSDQEDKKDKDKSKVEGTNNVDTDTKETKV